MKRKYILFLIVFLFGCSTQRIQSDKILESEVPGKTQTSTQKQVGEISSTPTSQEFPTNTLEVSPKVSQYTATKTPLDLTPITSQSLGDGMVSGVFSSPYNDYVYLDFDGLLKWYDPATFQEIGASDFGTEIIDIRFFEGDRYSIIVNPYGHFLFDFDYLEVIYQFECWEGGCNSGEVLSKDQKYLVYRVFFPRLSSPQDSIQIFEIDSMEIMEIPFISDTDWTQLTDPVISHDGDEIIVGYWNGNSSQLLFYDFDSREITYRKNFGSKIKYIELKKNRHLLAVGSSDGVVWLISPSTKEILTFTYGINKRILSLEFLPNETSILVNYWRAEKHIWNYASDFFSEYQGKTYQEEKIDSFLSLISERGIIQGPYWWHYPIGINLDGSKVAVGSDDVYIWDYQSGKLEMILNKPHYEILNKVEFSYDSNYIIGYSDSKLVVWDLNHGQEISLEVDLPNYYRFGVGKGVDVSRLDYSLAILLKDVIEIWDINNNELIISLQTSNEQIIKAISFSDNGKEFNAISNDYFVTRWDINSGAIIDEYQLPYQENYFYGFINGNTLIKLEEDVNPEWFDVWSLDTNDNFRQLIQNTNGFTPFYLSPDNKLLVGKDNNNLLVIYNLKQKKFIPVPTISLRKDIVSINPSNNLILVEDQEVEGKILIYSLNDLLNE